MSREFSGVSIAGILLLVLVLVLLHWSLPARSAELTLPAFLSALESMTAKYKAKRLLVVSGTAELYSTAAEQQVRQIVRTYASIVNMERDVMLPDSVKTAIANCYRREYAWENFEDGIVRILTQKFSSGEMQLLIDFQRGRGLAPANIDLFKGLRRRVAAVEIEAADFIYASSKGCVEQDAATINRYLASEDAFDTELSGAGDVGGRQFELTRFGQN